jgi:hypothetical protein
MILPVAEQFFSRNLTVKPSDGGMGKNVKKL